MDVKSNNLISRRFFLHQKIQTCCTILAVLISAIGLSLSACQNKETGEMLTKAGNAFSAMTYPVVKFHRYQWLTSPGGPSCETPPSGIIVYAMNVSDVPVSIEETHLEVYMGQKKISDEDSAEEEIGSEGGVILTRGETTSTGTNFPELAEAFLRSSDLTNSPHLNFKINVRYRSLVTKQAYCFSSKVTIFEDCRIPNQARYQIGDEKLSECEVSNLTIDKSE